MTEQWKKNSARAAWLVGALGAGVLTFSFLSIDGGIAAQPVAAEGLPRDGALSFRAILRRRRTRRQYQQRAQRDHNQTHKKVPMISRLV